MCVKGGGVAVVCVILNVGLLLAKGSHDAEDFTSVNSITNQTSSASNINHRSTSILTHNPSSTNKVIESISSTTEKSTLPKIPTSSSSTTPKSALTVITKSTSSTAPNSTLSTTPKSTLSKALKSTLSTKSKSTSPTTSVTSLSRATASHTIMTSVFSSTLRTPVSAHSSKISSKSQMSSTITTIPYHWSSSSTPNNVTDSPTNISTTQIPKIEGNSGLHISPGTALGIFVIVLIIVTVGSIIFYKMKKRGNLSCQHCKICLPRRRRRSSTSSRGPLTQDDATFVNITDHSRPERELFSIGDQDGGHDGRPGSLNRRGTEDEFFYDEIFGKSAFVDETTNRANTHLTVNDDDDDDELGGLNVPDLVFKKPKGI